MKKLIHKNGVLQILEEARVLRLLGTLLLGNVPLPTAINVVSEFNSNFKQTLLALQTINLETSLSETISKENIFSSFVYQFFSSKFHENFVLGFAMWKAASILDKTLHLIASGAEPKKIAEVNFYRILGISLSINIPYLNALRIASEQYLPEKDIIRLLNPTYDSEPLAVSMKSLPEYFSKQDRKLILFGGQTGGICELFFTLANLKERRLLRYQPLFNKSVTGSDAELIREYRNVSELLHLGIPFITTLETITEDSSDVRQPILPRILGKIKAGYTIGDAMVKDKFPDWQVHLVDMGERSGTLGHAFSLILKHLEWELCGIEPETFPEQT